VTIALPFLLIDGAYLTLYKLPRRKRSEANRSPQR